MHELRLRYSLVFCMLFCANCSRKSPISQETSPVVDAGVAPPSSASLDASDASVSPVSAWTDAPIVDRLRENCGFDPRKLSDAQKEELFGNLYGATELTCIGTGFDQSCVYDPCFETDERTCKTGCLKDCTTCDDACVSSCFACKANCGDDECRNACAPTCAECKQSCVASQDRCRSGKCGQAYADCRKKLSSDWKTQHCEAVCAHYSPCRTGCFEQQDRSKNDNYDLSGCLSKCAPATPTTCDLGLCSGKYSMGIEMK